MNSRLEGPTPDTSQQHTTQATQCKQRKKPTSKTKVTHMHRQHTTYHTISNYAATLLRMPLGFNIMEACRDFANGKCRRGSSCRFLHEQTIEYRLANAIDLPPLTNSLVDDNSPTLWLNTSLCLACRSASPGDNHTNPTLNKLVATDKKDTKPNNDTASDASSVVSWKVIIHKPVRCLYLRRPKQTLATKHPSQLKREEEMKRA